MVDEVQKKNVSEKLWGSETTGLALTYVYTVQTSIMSSQTADVYADSY
jgi:hypothetical protein